MKCISTRDRSHEVALVDALLAGPAPDGGLYVPRHLPRLTEPAGDGLAEVARATLAPFFAGESLADALPAIVAEAFADLVAPCVEGPDADSGWLELFHGPTAAFKDFGARFLAASMARLTADGARTRTVLVATSGDTGAAVAAAFAERAGFRVAILYPRGRVSERQAHQLGAYGDSVRAYDVAGSFDDCQRLVRSAFADARLRERHGLVSANSLGLGRLLPQMAYYVKAARDWQRRRGTLPGFIVPTGNLGNATAALLARACGAPIARVHLACNANRTLPDWLDTGEYRAQPTRATLANAMDVGDPSNAERVRWLLPDPAQRAALGASSADDPAIVARIGAEFARSGRVLDPHAAVAAEALARLRARGDRGEWICVATAHAAKFDETVEPITGPVPVPPALAAVLARPSSSTALDATPGALARALEAGVG